MRDCRRHETRAERRRRGAAVSALVVLALGLLVGGCARHTPLAEVASSGVGVWVRLETAEGEELTGTLVSLDAAELVIETRHRLVGDVRVSERGGRTELYSGAERVPGEIVRIDRDESGRHAIVHRSLRALDVDSATFHEGRGERSLANILSHILGPAVGGTLGLIL